MKTKLILAVLLIATTNAFPQKGVPQKGMNAILLNSKLSKEDAFKKWGQCLALNGFSIDKSDTNFTTLTTGPKNTSRLNVDFIVISVVNDSGVVINRLKWRINSSVLAGTQSTEFYDWVYKNEGNNASGNVYKDFITVAKKFSEDIIFEKR